MQAVIPSLTMHGPDDACKNHLMDFDLDLIFSFLETPDLCWKTNCFAFEIRGDLFLYKLGDRSWPPYFLSFASIFLFLLFFGLGGFDYITLALTITFGGRSTLHISTCVHIRRKGEGQETRTWNREGYLLHIFLY